MATVADSVTLSQAALDERRQAVECVLGSLRIEGLTLEGVALDAVESYASGQISLDEMSIAIRGYLTSLL